MDLNIFLVSPLSSFVFENFSLYVLLTLFFRSYPCSPHVFLIAILCIPLCLRIICYRPFSPCPFFFCFLYVFNQILTVNLRTYIFPFHGLNSTIFLFCQPILLTFSLIFSTSTFSASSTPRIQYTFFNNPISDSKPLKKRFLLVCKPDFYSFHHMFHKKKGNLKE